MPSAAWGTAPRPMVPAVSHRRSRRLWYGLGRCVVTRGHVASTGAGSPGAASRSRQPVRQPSKIVSTVGRTCRLNHLSAIRLLPGHHGIVRGVCRLQRLPRSEQRWVVAAVGEDVVLAERDVRAEPGAAAYLLFAAGAGDEERRGVQAAGPAVGGVGREGAGIEAAGEVEDGGIRGWYKGYALRDEQLEDWMKA